jgi:hypothetical protein
MLKPLAALLSALAFSGAAFASDITGSWTFTANVGEACTFSGVAVLSPTEDKSRYGCELTAKQICGEAIRFTVRQSCRAVRTGDQLSIQSTIEEFIEGEPTPFYYPDNFALTIQSDNRMVGALVSASTYRAIFTRSLEGIS